MPHFIKLTDFDDHEPIFLNFDLIVSIHVEDGRTYVNESGEEWGSWTVTETPEEILQFLKPQRLRVDPTVELPKK